MKAPREADVLAGCLTLLRLRRCLVWRQNQGGVHATSATGKRRFVRFTRGAEGLSDIIGVLPGGRFIAVETKKPGNRPTLAQESFLQAVRDAGGVGVCVCSVDELVEVLDGLGVPGPGG